jgi:hypothetical protein
MHFVTFIVAFVFILTAAILFGRGLVKMYQGNGQSRGLISYYFRCLFPVIYFGNPAIQGVCPTRGTKVFRIGKS